MLSEVRKTTKKWSLAMSARVALPQFATTEIPHAEIVKQLGSPDAYSPDQPMTVEQAGSYLSDVFLTWDDQDKTSGNAYKLRKPMVDEDLYLDYRKLEDRFQFGHDEIRMNIPNAPIYLGIRGVFEKNGRVYIERKNPNLDGAIDTVVAMIRMPKEDHMMSAMKAGQFDLEGKNEALAKAIADMHQRAPIIGQGRPNQAIEQWIAHNLSTARQVDGFIQKTLPGYRYSMEEVFSRALHGISATLQKRCSAGKFRECHGDLWSNNVWYHGGQFLLVDRNEYNSGLTNNDVLYDVAFLGADYMISFNKNDTADRLFEHYVNHAGDHIDRKTYNVFLALSMLFFVKVYFKFYKMDPVKNEIRLTLGTKALQALENLLPEQFKN